MCHALTRRLYETNTGNQIWFEGDAFPGALNQWQQNELVAAGHMYHMIENTFGYTSYDGADAEMRTINNNPAVSCPNATWNGATANYCTGTGTDDIVAHEWGHAYTEYTSNLIYAWQTGAINESYSDIWGETVDLLNGYEDGGEDLSLRTSCNNSLRWQMGEDATAFGGAIRDMWSPTCDGDPGKVTDNQYWCSTGDAGGVHINSGIPNHAYALLVDGGTYNGQTIGALGFTKTAHIFWRAQSVYLTSTSDFGVLASALDASCADLVGQTINELSTSATPPGASSDVIGIADCQQVSNAIAAVELNVIPDCNFTTILAQNEPSPCTVPEAPQNIFFENFEGDLSNWIVTQLPENPGTWDSREWTIEATPPKNWPDAAVFGPDPIIGDCGTDLDNGRIRLQSPQITIPASATNPVQMTFDHYVATENLWDGGNIKYRVNGGGGWTILPNALFTYNGYNGTLNTSGAGNDNPMAGQISFTGTDEGSVASSWGESQVDLSSLVGVGDFIELRWEMGSDGCNGVTGWYLDNIQVFSCQEIFVSLDLISFQAREYEEKVSLNWETINEKNNKGFFVEHSENGINWNELGFVAGHINSSERETYHFIDEGPSSGNNYYRLRIINQDNYEEYSPIEVVKIKASKIEVYPNPLSNELFLKIPNLTIGDKLHVELLNLSGKQIWLQEPNIQNSNSIELNATKELAQGVYILKIHYNEQTEVHKIVKMEQE